MQKTIVVPSYLKRIPGRARRKIVKGYTRTINVPDVEESIPDIKPEIVHTPGPVTLKPLSVFIRESNERLAAQPQTTNRLNEMFRKRQEH